MNRNIAAGKVTGGGIASAGLDVESVERAGVAVVGHVHGEADLLVLADFIDPSEVRLAAGGEAEIGDFARLDEEAGRGITKGKGAAGLGLLFRLGEGDMEIEGGLIAIA